MVHKILYSVKIWPERCTSIVCSKQIVFNAVVDAHYEHRQASLSVRVINASMSMFHQFPLLQDVLGPQKFFSAVPNGIQASQIHPFTLLAGSQPPRA